MKTSIRIAGVVAGLVLVGASTANAGITNSWHDLSLASTSTSSADVNTSASRELCAFCHTPHAANTAFSGAPLWNKAAPSAGSFTLYGNATGGKTLAGTTISTVNSQSMACLSCHDGVSAINSIVNAPGSGGLSDGTTYVDMWSATALDNDGDGFTLTDINNSSYATAGATGVRIIGQDLSNDHPVSVEYLGTGAAGSPASLRATTFDLSTITAWKTPSGTQTIAAILKDNAGVKSVECGSCHDPHFTDNGRFLRANNDGSKLCLSCHEK